VIDNHLRERLVERHEAFAGKLLHVVVDTVEAEAGGRATREVVLHPGAVAIVATDADGRILLVRQWRHPVDRALWEIPAGTLEPGEEPAVTAHRELEEETGHSAQWWEPLGATPLAPGYSSEVVHLFAARQLTSGNSHPDHDENIVAAFFTPAEVAGLIRAAEVDMKTIAGLALAGLATPVDG